MTRDDAERRRIALLEKLTRGGWLRTTAWQEAFQNLPRHVFLPRFFRLTPDGQRYEAIDHQHPDWLDLIYTNSVATTQLDSDDTRWQEAREHGPVEGTATSSSTQPSLMATMLEALDIRDDQQVLEVGTGTGYNAALLCYRLGDQHVTSIEYDAGVASQARQALTTADYHPTLTVGDGANGYPDNAPYDRLIATYSVSRIPPAWLAQLRAGGVIVTSLHRELGVGLMVRLVAASDGAAHGHLLGDSAYFMPTRTEGGTETRALVRAASKQIGEMHTSTLPGPVSDDAAGWTALAGLLMPDVARLDISRDDGQLQWLVHPDGSWAYYQLDDRRVEQGGPQRLWDDLHAIYQRWQALGEPGRGRIGLTVLPDGAQRVWVDQPGNLVDPQRADQHGDESPSNSADQADGVDPTPAD
jgi:methyltransferase of ATP-grasp peptide maturase system